MNPQVDLYLEEGCGRCPLGGTPQCKVHRWQDELRLLRRIVLDCGLTEERKWGIPCYTYRKANIAIVAAFKDHCVLSFFKGSLLQDTEGILEKPGEDSESGRVIRFTRVLDIVTWEPVLKAYLYEAIEVEKAGLKVQYRKPSELDMPEELRKKLEQIPELKAAFEALTPGRQKGYIFHITQPKQSKTRESRVEKSIPLIMSGKGLNDDYEARKRG